MPGQWWVWSVILDFIISLWWCFQRRFTLSEDGFVAVVQLCEGSLGFDYFAGAFEKVRVKNISELLYHGSNLILVNRLQPIISPWANSYYHWHTISWILDHRKYRGTITFRLKSKKSGGDLSCNFKVWVKETKRSLNQPHF